VQIFATDIDSQAIDVARAGVYPAGIAADVTPDRLERFFSKDPEGGMWNRSSLLPNSGAGRKFQRFLAVKIVLDPGVYGGKA